MAQKGLIVKIEKEQIIVLTELHEYVKIQRKNNCLVGQKIFFTEDDVIKEIREVLFMSKKFMAVAAVFIMILSLGSIWGLSGLFDGAKDLSIATVMTIDINPSVKVSLNANDEVVAIKALNKDAETIDFDGIIGMKAEDAVEKIVSLAEMAGFINLEDLNEDYVLITTVSMDEDASDETLETLETLKTKIEIKITESEILQDVNVAIIKATKVEMLQAEGKKVPIGLYVVNGEIEIDGEKMTVKEYFSNSDHVKEFKNKGEVIDRKLSLKIELANKFIDKLETRGYDVTLFKSNIALPDADVDAILAEIKAIWSTMETETEILTLEPTTEGFTIEPPTEDAVENDAPGKSDDAPGKSKNNGVIKPEPGDNKETENTTEATTEATTENTTEATTEPEK